MSKICGTCGNLLDDQAMFCTKCGTPYQAPAAPQPEPQPQAWQPAAEPVQEPAAPAPQRTRQPVKQGGIDQLLKNKKLVGILAAAVIATVTLIVILCVALSSSPEDALDNTIALMAGDADAFMDCVPECVAEQSAGKLEQNAAAIATMIQTTTAERFGEDFEVSYEIIKEAEMPEGMVHEIGVALGERYHFDPELVEAGYMFRVELEASGSKLLEWEEEDMYAVEVDGDWFLISDTDSPRFLFENLAY